MTTPSPAQPTGRPPVGPSKAAHDGTARPNVLAALFWMAVALASFTLVAITGRIAGAGADTAHVMFYRSAIALAIITLIILFTPAGIYQVHSRRLGLHLVRNSIHFVAQYSWLSALMLIPLAQLFAIEFTAPLWVAVLAPVLLAEKLTLTRIAAAIVGFIGIIVIVQPGTVPLSLGTAFALIAALGFASSMIATKTLVRTETIFSILFHMSWMQLVISGLWIARDIKVPPIESMLGIAGVAVAGMSAHFALARAFTHADAIIVAPMDFLRLPLIMYVGLLIYNEPIEPTVLTGASIVILANVINILGERRRRKN